MTCLAGGISLGVAETLIMLARGLAVAGASTGSRSRSLERWVVYGGTSGGGAPSSLGAGVHALIAKFADCRDHEQRAAQAARDRLIHPEGPP